MRDRMLIQPRFFETYHYADVVTDLVMNQQSNLGLWSEFFMEGAAASLAVPFAKKSALHRFIGFVIDHLLHDYTLDVDISRYRLNVREWRRHPESFFRDPTLLPVEVALRARALDFQSFDAWIRDQQKDLETVEADDVYEYFKELRLMGTLEELVDQSSREVFFTLFADRKLLLDFNDTVAGCLKDVDVDEISECRENLGLEVSPLFRRSGVLKRVAIPKWVRKAVFFRDRGRCVHCHKDLSGIISLWSRENYDHMVPLSSGGLNDVTNVQLLCAKCNNRKSDGVPFTSSEYENWYPMPRS